MAPPSVNTHTHWTLPTTMSVLETPFDIHVSSVYQTHTCMQAPVSTPCISAKKTHNKGSRTQPIMSTLMPRSGIPVICSRATLSCDSSYFSHVGTEPPLPGYYQFFLGGKYVLLKDITRRPEWGWNPRPLDPESEVLTTRPPRPHI